MLRILDGFLPGEQPPDRLYAGRIFVAMSLAIFDCTLALVAYDLWEHGAVTPTHWVYLAIVVGILIWLKRGGSVAWASMALIGCSLALLPVRVITDGGVFSPTFMALPFTALMATFLAGTRAGLLTLVVQLAEIGLILTMTPTGDADQAAQARAYAVLGALISIIIYVFAWLYEWTQRQAAESVRESEARYALVSRATTDGIWDWDLADRLYLSPRCFDLVDIPLEGLTEPQRQIEGLAHPADLPALRAAIAAHLRGGEPFSVTLRLRARGGGFRWFSARGAAFQGSEPPSDRPSRMVGTLRDVTDERRLDQAKSEFISIVSHELRTPLTSIRGALQLIQAGILSPEERQEFTTIASQNSDRLLDLVNDLLDLQQLEVGRMEMSPERFTTAPIVEQALSLSRPLAEQQGCTLRLIACPTADHIYADPGRFEQILTNLISNAVRHSPPGEEVLIELGQSEGWSWVRVSDRGPGVPDPMKDRIFEKFERADAPLDQITTGTGLGLSISKALVEAHGGDIGVQDRDGGGSTFFVELPAAG